MSRPLFEVTTERTSVHPSKDIKDVKTIALSILDATTSRFAATAAVWVYRSPISAPQLKTSLSMVLDAYPHWGGHLQEVTAHSGSDHRCRYGRLFVVYGTQNDPGVEYTVATTSASSSSFIPEANWRSEGRFWNATDLPLPGLVPTTPLAVQSGRSSTIESCLPSMTIQVTSFTCGSVAVAARVAHPLADAHSLMEFMRDWAAVYRSAMSNGVAPMLSPLFCPSLLDAAATGDIDNPVVDESIVEQSRLLPSHRYDWFRSTKDCPPIMRAATIIPEGFRALIDDVEAREDGEPMPWDEWDIAAPVEHYLFHFDGDKLARLHNSTPGGGQRLSHLDCLLAHLWFAINLARFEGKDQRELVYMNQTISLRGARLSANLPVNYIGSPILLARVASPASAPPSDLARNIRSTVARFSAETLGAKLYEFAMETSPPWRIWNAFLGRRNLIVTSWIGEGMYELDFGMPGHPNLPVYAEGVMPSMDGLVQILDVPDRSSSKSSRWYQRGGADVSVHLTSASMSRVIEYLTTI
ncbi:hypothetical protein EYR40_001418 [Pleurotus pulmonarius]|nr:hypothetical protein EYR38_004659 [Pleurotus pulmonarius]KAF4609065.1 hypothetical protein EYR40_001418 [Pleurotus pulmonarius]